MAPSSTEVEIAESILAGEESSLHNAIFAACAKAADEHLTDRVKKRWLAKNKDRIEETGCDPEQAYQAWRHGKIDELAYAIESNVLEALEEECLDDEDVE